MSTTKVVEGPWEQVAQVAVMDECAFCVRMAKHLPLMAHARIARERAKRLTHPSLAEHVAVVAYQNSAKVATSLDNSDADAEHPGLRLASLWLAFNWSHGRVRTAQTGLASALTVPPSKSFWRCPDAQKILKNSPMSLG